MKIVVSAGGRFHAHRLAQQLQKHDSLLKFFTFDFTGADRQFFGNNNVIPITTCTLLNSLFTRFRLARLIDKSRFNVFKDNLFDSLVSKKIKNLQPIDLFIGWAHYAHKSIPAARKAGAKIIIESGSCHIATQQELLDEEYKRWGVPYKPIDERTRTKMIAEYNAADYIMTLSSFARNSFAGHGIDSKKLLMSPCGFDIEYFRFAREDKKTSFFRVIFVGLVSLRKGVQYLIQAWDKLGLATRTTELVIVGVMQKDFALIAHKLPIGVNVKFIGSVNRSELKKLYQESSLFVLPSIEDGFGMVIGEAMASGLPVICSTNSAGPDLINEGQHGLLTAPANVQDLAEKIGWCYEYQEQAALMGYKGMLHIASHTWDAYGERVYTIYRDIITSSKK